MISKRDQLVTVLENYIREGGDPAIQWAADRLVSFIPEGDYDTWLEEFSNKGNEE